MQPSTPTTGGLQTQADLLNNRQQHCQEVRPGCDASFTTHTGVCSLVLVFVLEPFQRAKPGPYALLSLFSDSTCVQEYHVCVCVLLRFSVAIVSQD